MFECAHFFIYLEQKILTCEFLADFVGGPMEYKCSVRLTYSLGIFQIQEIPDVGPVLFCVTSRKSFPSGVLMDLLEHR